MVDFLIITLLQLIAQYLGHQVSLILLIIYVDLSVLHEVIGNKRDRLLST